MEKDNKKSKSPFAFLQDKMVPKVHYHVTVLSGCSCIPTKSNVYYCLQFPSNWRFLWTLHTRFQRGASTIPQIVYEVCDSIYEVLQPIYMSPPSDEDWKQIEHRFNMKWNFPNCIGSLDGKHIMMRCPPNSHSLYTTTTKDFFSIVLMALVDADYRFIHIDGGNYGSNGDSGIFKNSALEKLSQVTLLNIPGPKRLPGYPEGGALPHCIVVDEAFPLRMDLMRPYPVAKNRTGWPMINLCLTTISVGLGGL